MVASASRAKRSTGLINLSKEQKHEICWFGSARRCDDRTPAVARDGQGYIGVEGGVLFPDDIDIDVETVLGADIDDAYEIGLENGFDVDLIGGYDFGMVRGEAELGYKRASVDESAASSRKAPTALMVTGSVNVLSIMGNVLFDIGVTYGFSGYGGAGIGYARVRVNDVESAFDQIDGKESGLAWQLVPGARYAVSDNIDLSLKYRYFQGPENGVWPAVHRRQLRRI